MSDTVANPRHAVAYVGLGANLGDRLVTMRGAVRALAAIGTIDLNEKSDVAPLFETSPVGVPFDQSAYLNSVVRLRTSVGPRALLQKLLEIEAHLGRVRREKYGPRRIDLDLLFYDNVVMKDAVLALPHPRLLERRFVIEPLVALAPDLVHPVTRETIRAAAERLRERGGEDQVTPIGGPDWVGGPHDGTMPPGGAG